MASLVGAFALGSVPWPLTTKGDCVIRPATRVRVRSAIDGTISAITLGDGARVVENAVVVTLDDTELRYELHRVVARLARFEIDLRNTEHTSHARRPEMDRLRSLRDEVLAERQLLERRLLGTRVVSPISGVIVNPRSAEQRGLAVKRGEVLFEVIDERLMEVEMRVEEEDIDLPREGQPISVKVPSMPERTFRGLVDSMSARLQADPGGRNYLAVRTFIRNDEGLLRSEMSGVAEICAGRSSLLRIAARRSIRWIRLRLLI